MNPRIQSSWTPSTRGERRTVFERAEIQPDSSIVCVLSEKRAGCFLKDHQDLFSPLNKRDLRAATSAVSKAILFQPSIIIKPLE